MDNSLITKKLEQAKEYLAELRELCAKETGEILSNSYFFHTSERLLQLIVDTCVDINIHLIREKTGKVPDDLQSTFVALGEIGILDMPFALRIAPVVGLRNRIVHRYDTLDRKTFIETLKKEVSYFDKYLQDIRVIIV